jgi:hypothetical protein
MARAAQTPVRTPHTGTQATSRTLTGKKPGEIPVKNPRAPVQILMSTKEWLDQIMAENKLRTYDEAIMFLITERQRSLPSDLGVFSDMEEYVCDGED